MLSGSQTVAQPITEYEQEGRDRSEKMSWRGKLGRDARLERDYRRDAGRWELYFPIEADMPSHRRYFLFLSRPRDDVFDEVCAHSLRHAC